MGRLRDEEQLSDELAKKYADLQVEVQKMEEAELHLKGESKHLETLQTESKERQKLLLEEKHSNEELVETLTRQNNAILEEMDSHNNTHEVVRTHLDRRQEVSHMMSNFNRDLVESKHTLERVERSSRGSSPLR